MLDVYYVQPDDLSGSRADQAKRQGRVSLHVTFDHALHVHARIDAQRGGQVARQIRLAPDRFLFCYCVLVGSFVSLRRLTDGQQRGGRSMKGRVVGPADTVRSTIVIEQQLGGLGVSRAFAR